MNLHEQELTQRIKDLEERVARLESTRASDDDGEFVFVDEPTSLPSLSPPAQTDTPRRQPATATQILGWAGILALVMAAAYLIKLGIDLGWLTPTRQVLLALTGGVGLIVSGLVLRRADRDYAGILPAGGVAILFLTVYGAHLYYRLIGFPTAVSSVFLICLLALWLCHHFASELYAYIAIVASYSAPLLLDGLRANVTDLAIYYTAWSLLFCIYAIWLQQRRIYLVAAYMALLGFDLIWYQQWHWADHPQWRAALVFQAIQFLVYATGTTIYTLRHQQKLDTTTAIIHLPPLILFYALEYNLLDRYLQNYAPWVALASLAALFVIYLVARTAFRYTLEGGHLILSSYAALVLSHALYLELLPDQMTPWIGLAAGIAITLWLAIPGQPGKANWPLLGALGLIFAINALRSLLNYDLSDVVAHDYLTLVYAIEIYIAYFFIRRAQYPAYFRGALLYTGHLSAMAAPVHIFDNRLPVSFCWAILAVIALVLARSFRDRMLAHSALFVFAVSGAKVLLYDLDNAAPLIRIGCLVILGISFYIGGWLYRKVNEFEQP